MQTNNDKNQRIICLDPTPIDQLIQRGNLKSIMEKAQLLGTLNKLLMTFLPEALHQYCQVANFRDHVLIIHVDSATHATLLRYRTQQLLGDFKTQTESQFIKEIQLKVRPKGKQPNNAL